MSSEEKDALLEQLVKSHGQHKILLGVGAVFMAITLAFAAFGAWEWFSTREDQKARDAKMEAAITAITNYQGDLTKLVAAQQAQFEKVNQINTELSDLRKETANLRAAVNRPLPQPQQDQFFVSRGFAPSYYQQDGGRLFGPDATVKLQTTIVDAEGCQQLLAKTDEKVLTQDGIIENYKAQVKDYDAIDVQRLKQIEILKTDLTIAQKETRKEKAKKWTYSIVTGLISGYVGYKVGHNQNNNQPNVYVTR